MTKPKRTIATTLLCLCIIPFLAVPVGADTGLDRLKEKLQAEMTSTQTAVKGKAELDTKAQNLIEDVRQFNRVRATSDNVSDLKDRASRLIERAKALREEASAAQGVQFEEPVDDVLTPEQIEQRRRDIYARVKVAVGEAEAAGKAVAGNPSISEKVKQLYERRVGFETSYGKVGKKQELLTLERTGNELIRDAQALKADADNLLPGWLDSIFSLATLILLAQVLLALAVLGALAYAGWFVFKLNRRVGDLETMHGKVVQRFVVLEKTLGEQKAYALTVESGVTRLRDDMARGIGELQRSYRDMRTGQRPAAVAPDPFAYLDRGPVRDPGPTFPALVSDYLSKVSESKKVEVEADFRTNLFVPAPGGPFVLVQDDDGTGSGIVLPKSRLQKGQEFVSYYKGIYYCDSPSAGEVFIVEPAVVDHTGSGWRLRSPGRLELK